MATKITKTRLWVIAAAAVLILIVMNSGQDRPGSGAPESQAGGLCLMKVTADAPVRSGPTRDASAVGTLPAGVVIQANRTIRHEFREVPPNRWVERQHLEPTPGSGCG